MKTKNNKTIALAFLTLMLGMILFLGSGTVSASYLVYNESTIYSQSSHVYSIPQVNVDYVTLKTRVLANDQVARVKFSFNDGTSYTTPYLPVANLAWTERTFTNIYPNSKVNYIAFYGSSSIYFKDLFVYGQYPISTNGDGEGPATCPTDTKRCADGSYVSRNIELDCAFNPCPEEMVCGDGTIDEDETCDNNELNGVVCSANYGSSCTYCSNSCEIITVRGGYCGDGILNEAYERCDDGNRYDNDKCTNECKKPFEVIVEDFEPLVWQCDSRVVYDDATEPGRVSEKGQPLVERMNNYAFEGEKVKWLVLVMDKNGIEKVKDVYVSVNGNMEANCDRLDGYTYSPNNPNEGISLFNSVGGSIGFEDDEENEDPTHEEPQIINPNMLDPSCNARILEEKLTTFNEDTMAYYECTLTVETFDSMQGESEVVVEAEDLDGVIGMMDEVENWFFNPVIQLSIDGDAAFDEVRPGTSAYSQRVIIGNDAEYGSGVLLDMFISGTDFYDSSSSGAKCPTTNKLSLSNFAYYATNGAYSTHNDMQVQRTCDAEGYCNVNYGIGFNDPFKFYNRNEIIQANQNAGYYLANILSPGAEMTLIFRLNLPEPCNGDFDTGSIYFWGEAI